MTLKLILRVAVIFISIRRGGGETCGTAVNGAIQRCVLPVARYAKVLNARYPSSSSASAISLPNLGTDVFTELCGLIRRFDTCVKDWRLECPGHLTISLIDASYGFLCNEGYQTFMNSADCLMELDGRPNVKVCHDQTIGAIQAANDHPAMSLAQKVTHMCRSLNSFAQCVRSPIEVSCGTEAWHVILRVLRDTTLTLMPACQFSVSKQISDRQPALSTEPPQPLNVLTVSTDSVRQSVFQPRTTSASAAHFHPLTITLFSVIIYRFL